MNSPSVSAQLLAIDYAYLEETLLQLLAIPSPVGLTDAAVRYTAGRFEALGVPYEITRRGAIRATLKGQASQPARAVVAHLDTLGAMVKSLKPNGRLEIVPIGHWSARFAEGGAAHHLHRPRPCARHLPAAEDLGPCLWRRDRHTAGGLGACRGPR
jgi:hypothetical protein